MRARRVIAYGASQLLLTPRAVIIAVLLAFLKKTNNMHMKPQGTRTLAALGPAQVAALQLSETTRGNCACTPSP